MISTYFDTLAELAPAGIREAQPMASNSPYITQRRPPFRPAAGLCLPCKVVKIRDADTIEISLPGSSYCWAIRLLDCWAPELHTDAGKAAAEYATKLLRDADTLHVFIPPPEHSGELLNLLKSISFDRLLGYIYLDERTTLNDALVSAGFATSTKDRTN